MKGHLTAFLQGDTGVGFYMRKEIDAFISYMHEQRQTSENTEAAYARDLRKLMEYVQQE